MSPTSYQTAPPRERMVTKGVGQVKALCVCSVDIVYRVSRVFRVLGLSR